MHVAKAEGEEEPCTTSEGDFYSPESIYCTRNSELPSSKQQLEILLQRGVDKFSIYSWTLQAWKAVKTFKNI
jgi:hypothetical protein